MLPSHFGPLPRLGLSWSLVVSSPLFPANHLEGIAGSWVWRARRWLSRTSRRLLGRHLLEVSRAAGVLLSLLLQTASWHLTAFSTFSTNSDQTLQPSLSRTHVAVVHTCEKASAIPHFPPGTHS